NFFRSELLLSSIEKATRRVRCTERGKEEARRKKRNRWRTLAERKLLPRSQRISRSSDPVLSLFPERSIVEKESRLL
ncbi:unnamed protein product, partial [Ilex paraguariensis]